MKFGVNMWVWISPTTLDDLKKYAPKIKSMGFDLLEIGIENIEDLDYAEARKILQEHDLGITLAAAMGPDRDLIHEDESIQANGKNYIRQCIEAAHTIESKILCGPMYAAVGRTWEQTPDGRKRDKDVLVNHLYDLAKYAGEHGVTLSIEPLNRFETSFLNTTDQAIEIIDAVNHSNCKIHLDTFHMNIEEKALGDAIRSAGHRIGHFHACENDRGAPGSGLVHWDEVIPALKEVNYDGSIVIESFTNKVKTIARAAAIWRAFEPSQDALAENGLAFLKQKWG